LQKQKKGPTKGLYNFKVVFFSPDFDHRANQKVALMMDGLDPLLFKSDGHNSLIATLLTERKTYWHFIQASNVLCHLCCYKLRFHHH
jgi:hypothetical protein